MEHLRTFLKQVEAAESKHDAKEADALAEWVLRGGLESLKDGLVKDLAKTSGKTYLRYPYVLHTPLNLALAADVRERLKQIEPLKAVTATYDNPKAGIEFNSKHHIVGALPEFLAGAGYTPEQVAAFKQDHYDTLIKLIGDTPEDYDDFFYGLVSPVSTSEYAKEVATRRKEQADGFIGAVWDHLAELGLVKQERPGEEPEPIDPRYTIEAIDPLAEYMVGAGLKKDDVKTLTKGDFEYFLSRVTAADAIGGDGFRYGLALY
ncbi:Hypothetical protein POVN_LOCUS134 [uncultured virus]|nr:Hypothetical protein POVN_LOCUS134 [uncultured virus]